MVIALLILVAACSSDDSAESNAPASTTTTTESSNTTQAPGPMVVRSPSFQDGEPIPVEFTCDGSDINPRLDVTDIPTNVDFAVLIVEDPDAPLGTWIHWVEYDIPVEGGTLTIEEAAGPIGVQGVNSWNLPGYGGPCPPEGETHEYIFTVYVLSEALGLPGGVEVEMVRQAMTDETVGQTELRGTYGR